MMTMKTKKMTEASAQVFLSLATGLKKGVPLNKREFNT